MKLADEMVCVVSLTQAPPKKQTLPSVSSPCSTENSHWMECLIKEPKPNIFSSSRSMEKVSVEVKEQSVNQRQISGVSDLSALKSLGMPVSSAFELPRKKVNRTIPIFKGKLMQMNRKTTNQIDGKKRKNAERHSPVKNMGASSSASTVCKSSITQVYKPVQNTSGKIPTHSSFIQIMTEKAYIKQGVSVFQWKREPGGQMTTSVYSDKSAAGHNSGQESHNKANSPSFLKNGGPVISKSNISPSLNTHASITSSSRRGKMFASPNATQVLEQQHQSKKAHLQICKLDNGMTNCNLSQQQTNEGPGLNIHKSILNDTMCITKNNERKASCSCKDCIATTCLHSRPNCEQVQ